MPSGILRKYAPDDVSSSVGTQAVTGVKEGTFIEADRDVDMASMEAGSDGEVTLIISPIMTGKVKFTLQQASPLNDYFTTLQQAIQNKDTTNGIVPLLVKDKNGTTVIQSQQAIIQKPVKVTFADKTEGREWTFLCPYLDIAAGGNASV